MSACSALQMFRYSTGLWPTHAHTHTQQAGLIFLRSMLLYICQTGPPYLHASLVTPLCPLNFLPSAPEIADWPDVRGLVLKEVTQRVPVQPQLHQLQAFYLVQLPVRLQLDELGGEEDVQIKPRQKVIVRLINWAVTLTSLWERLSVFRLGALETRSVSSSSLWMRLLLRFKPVSWENTEPIQFEPSLNQTQRPRAHSLWQQ